MSSSKRVRKFLVPVFLIAILAVSMLVVYMSHSEIAPIKADPNAYVGIAFCGNTTTEAKQLIDRTKTYTNLFVLDSGRNPISRNQSAVEEICDYATANGLNIIINLGIGDVHRNDSATWFWHQPLEGIKQNWTERWGTKLLGIYYNDEPGGIQLDGYWANFYREVGKNLFRANNTAANSLNQIYQKMLNYVYNGTKPQDYDMEAKFFVQDFLKDDPGLIALNNASISSFVSDYGLYWFDYLGGYDVLLAQLGWNSSVSQQIALVKGAARMQDKEWGAIITWKYRSPPFLDSGDQIYNQMLMSYQAGAKYIVIFNYALLEGNGYPAMNDEHFIALERFWNDITHKKFADLSPPEAALVLPSNYGWGMRNPNDTIWGFWPSDEKSQQVGTVMSKLLARYGPILDIVYEDSAYPVTKVNYQHVYYWNSTAL